MRTIYISLLSLLFAATTAHAQQPVALSMEDCMNYALKHNYTIKNAQLDVLIQKAQVNEQISAAYPHITGRVEVDDYLNPQKTFIPGEFFGGAPGTFVPITFTPKYASGASVNATQPIFDGAVLVALQARKAVVELAKNQGDVTEETVRYNVFKAYNSLVIAYRQFAITKGSLAFSRQIEHDTKVTQDNGMAEKIDVERASVQVNNLETDSIKVANTLILSEQTLKYQIGMDILTPIELTDTDIVDHQKEILTLLSEDGDYTRVPEYNLFHTQLLLNQYNVKRYQYAGLPTLNLVANLGDNYSTNRYADIYNWPHYLFYSMVGVQLNVPIFNGFMRDNQVREAKLNVEKSKNNIDNIKLTLDFQTASSRTTLQNSLLEVRSQHRNLDLANDVLDLAQRKYKAGVGSNLEVTQAQRDQLSAQTNYFNALLSTINAEADLKKALGLLK